MRVFLCQLFEYIMLSKRYCKTHLLEPHSSIVFEASELAISFPQQTSQSGSRFNKALR